MKHLIKTKENPQGVFKVEKNGGEISAYTPNIKVQTIPRHLRN